MSDFKDEFMVKAEEQYYTWVDHSDLTGDDLAALYQNETFKKLWIAGYVRGTLQAKQEMAPDEDLDDPMDWLFDDE